MTVVKSQVQYKSLILLVPALRYVQTTLEGQSEFEIRLE